jgi:cytochrome c oxidase cbb3-type subunit 3
MSTPHSENSSPEPQLREHEYDGIQEYDQKLPNWWLFTLYITIVWFVVAWLAYYQLGIGNTDTYHLENELAAITLKQESQMAGIDDERLWAMSQDATVVAAGKQVYLTTCVACHAPDLSATMAGAKLPGLPLKDKEWKHGGNPRDILNIVRKGAPDVTKGMVAWEGSLGIRRVTEVVAYILSHHKKGEPWTLAADAPKS